MTVRPGARQGADFFDMQAAVGITTHMGGLEATRELLALCRVQEAHEVLDVGCGIGAGPAYIAKTFGCRVVGVDLSERMIGWARRRARQQRVQALAELCAADVLALPFPDGRFDVVVCESVLAFVADKTRAIGECVRVTKPGGHVGLNEGLWLAQPPPGMAERVTDAIGPSVPTEEDWRSLWAASGLQDRVVRIKHVDPRAESTAGSGGSLAVDAARLGAGAAPVRHRSGHAAIDQTAVRRPPGGVPVCRVWAVRRPEATARWLRGTAGTTARIPDK